MSEHKNGRSNWSDEQRKLYWERREHNLPGSPPPVTINKIIIDDKGGEHIIPIGTARGGLTSGSHLMRKGSSKVVDRRFTKKGFHGHRTPKKITPYVSKTNAGK